MSKKIYVANAGASIDLPRIIDFLNEATQNIDFCLVDNEIIIDKPEVTPSAFDSFASQVPNDCLYYIIYTDVPYYNNFFYEIHGKLVIISGFGWDSLTKLPKNNGAAFAITEVLSDHIDPSFRHMPSDGSKPQCIYDFLVDKSGIDAAIKSASVCPDCQLRIQSVIDTEDIRGVYVDFRNLLNHIGLASRWGEDLTDYWVKQSSSLKLKAKKNSIFISYSHCDNDWLVLVKKFLKPLERDANIEIWDDSKIRTGDTWREEIELALSDARSAILLVSAEFLASDFVIENELPKLLLKAESEGTRIYPLLVAPSMFERTELAHFQSVNSPSKTLVELNRGERDRCLLKLSYEILDHFKKASKVK